MDELDALTSEAEIRAILANAGRWDLADLAWNELCPSGVPLTVRRDALRMAGYRPADRPAPPPEPAPRRLSLGEQRAHRRAVVLGEARAHAAAKGITADSPTLLDPGADLAYATERADYSEER